MLVLGRGETGVPGDINVLARMCGLAVYTHLDLSVFIHSVVGVQEGYDLLFHGYCRHLYCKLNVGIYWYLSSLSDCEKPQHRLS